MQKRPITQPTLLSEQFEKIKETLAKRKKYIKNDYQAYGMELASELGEWDKRSIYIRLAKTTSRAILDKARYFIKDQNQKTIASPGKLFMWKLGQLKKVDKMKEKI